MTITKNGKRNRNHIGNADMFAMAAPRICVTMERPTMKEFGWADFPLLGQSLVPDSELPMDEDDEKEDGAARVTVVTASIGSERGQKTASKDVLSSLASSKSFGSTSDLIRRRRRHSKFGKSHSSSNLEKKQRRGSKHAERSGLSAEGDICDLEWPDDLDRKPEARKVAPADVQAEVSDESTYSIQNSSVSPACAAAAASIVVSSTLATAAATMTPPASNSSGVSNGPVSSMLASMRLKDEGY